MKRAVDSDSTPGQFILTGSVRAPLVQETLAGTGRIVRMNMYPLVERELRDVSQPTRANFLARLAATGVDDLRVPFEPPVIDDYVRSAVRGGFPEIVYRQRSEHARDVWLESYLDDIVNRDVAPLNSVEDLVKLRRFLTAVALSNAGIPTDASLHRAADVNAKSAAGT